MFFMKRVILLSAVCLSFVSASALGAEPDTKQVKQEFEQVFQKMLNKPDDLDLTMRYAELAVKLKDYEAAIPALERILIFNPELPKVRLGLGTLYYRLRSFDMAKAYFLQVLEGDNVAAPLRAEASGYLKRIN